MTMMNLDLSPERLEAIIRAARLADVAPVRLIHSILEVWADEWLNREDLERGDEPSRRVSHGLVR